jgi:hypothetical protein
MLTAEQMELGRRQIEIEQSLLAQGMPPRQAAEMAARQVMPAPQEREYESFPPPRKVADPAYEGYSDEELATIYGIEAERAMVGQPYSKSRQTNVRQELRLRGLESGNGADVDNLAGAATAFGMEPDLGGAVSQRGFSEWANETPGTERQAQYDPEGYEQFREGVRNDIRNQARADEMTFGAGPDRAVSPLQKQNREARRASEDRVRDAQRGDFYQDRLLVDQGVEVPALGPDATVEELERAAYRDRYARRQAELDARKQAVVRTRMAQTNPLEYMNRGDIGAWNRFAAAQNVLGGRVRGATPNDVDQAREQAKAAIQGRLAMQPGGQQPTAAQERAAEALAEARRREVTDPLLIAQEAVAAGNFSDPVVAKIANEIVNKSYSKFVLGLPSTRFEDSEVTEAAGQLAARLNITLEQALPIMRQIQAERRTQGWISGDSRYGTWF